MLSKIFKAYDVRGTYPDQLNEEIAYKIGKAFVTFLGCKDEDDLIEEASDSRYNF